LAFCELQLLRCLFNEGLLCGNFAGFGAGPDFRQRFFGEENVCTRLFEVCCLACV
jgi:hypothetical protein